MGIYAKYILPRFLNKEMGSSDFNESRSRIVKDARGVVLEIGFGSGLNLPFYKNIERLYALEPSLPLYEYAQERIRSVSFSVEHLPAVGEKIPLSDSSIDSVVSTWTLCSVADLPEVLAEIYRVLKPGGLFCFVEHGLSPKRLNAATQKIITPISKHFTGNCHLDRDIDTAIAAAGFMLRSLDKAAEKRRPLMFSFRGVAIKES